MIKTPELRQNRSLRHADDHSSEAEDRTDGEINVAGDNDQHHARRHYGDRGGLNREVP
jgi:hypothetical protein